MNAKQQELFQRQEIIAQGIRKIGVNFSKDGPGRKSAAYIKVRTDNLNALWSEFEMNNSVLQHYEVQNDEYYTTKAFERTKLEYSNALDKLKGWPIGSAVDDDSELSDSRGESSKNIGVLSKSDELTTQQATNFRAFSRCIRHMNIAEITEKWDIEDKLKNLESRWKLIDKVHWQLDNLLVGSDVNYELEFSRYEEIYETTKRDLNRKLNLAVQQRDSAPKIEIPTFSGNYSQWPTFLDLYTAAIHNNPSFSKGQKMQHLKGKLKGEAERLVQHLPVSENNYDSCWDILNHRYNNLQLLFTKQMHTMMGQPTINNQSAYDLKRLHDTSLENVHALRNLGIDTSTWDPILVYILASKLDTQTYSDYMEARKHPRELPDFREFIEFIESKFTALELVSKKRNPSTSANSNKQPHVSSTSHNKGIIKTYNRESYNNYKNYPKANFTTSERNCPICKTNHILRFCKAFQNMTSEEKMKTIVQLDICKNCMYQHKDSNCHSRKRCLICNDTHHTSLHEVARVTSPTTSTIAQLPTNAASNKGSQGKANHVSGNFNEVLLATVQVQIKAADGTYITMRCLLDQGSQLNLITESAAQRLGLPRCNQNSTVSGIGTSASHSNGTVTLNCMSRSGDYLFTTQALVMAKLLNNLPNYSFEKQDWPHTQNISLADPDYNLSRPIDILLDAGVYAEIIMDNILRGDIHSPIAQQTKLGWVLLGNTRTFNCHVVVNASDISRFWELEEITSHSETMTVEDEYCETLYSSTTKRRGDGRYEVRIPMKPDFALNLGESKPQAIAQFKQLEKRFARDEKLASGYKAFIEEYISLNHMKLCLTSVAPSCFLPHHGVLRPDSTTTKLRVVFNASASTRTGNTLNQLMECGPNLQQDLQAMILRWRSFEYVYTADIEKFYRQIRIQESDQQLQKIVWRDSTNKPLQEFQLTTVTYGTKSAPFLAMRTIKQLIKDDGSQYPIAAAILSNQLYVDDLLGGNNDLLTAQKAQTELIHMLKGGGFNLRKWASNTSTLLSNLPEEYISQKMFNFKDAESNKTLEITWNPCTDQFTYKQLSLSDKLEVITKRTLLSEVSKLYDPLGWLSPLTLRAKLIFQQAWITSKEWDEVLPHNIQQQWIEFRQQMSYIHDIIIPRWIGNIQESAELHGFCDASEKAYGCVVYCKTIDKQGNPLIRLVAAKTKLAPLKKPISLPRLELCGAVLLAQLIKKIIESIDIKIISTHCWTDSMVVLGWLQGEVSRWKSFVANRVTQITQTIPSKSWRHVKSEENPADCASRGLSPSDILTHTLWWNAPPWIRTNYTLQQNNFNTNEEQRKHKNTFAVQTYNAPLVEDILRQCSTMTHATRVICWIKRFIYNSRNATNANYLSHLTTKDIELTINFIIRTVQFNCFIDDINYLQKYNKLKTSSKLLTLNPILDEYGILRVGGRLQHSILNKSQKHPVILPSNHRLVELLIDQAHQHTLHGGARLTLGHLRIKFWILGGMKTIKKQLIRCVTCHRHKTQRSCQQMADLPAPRVTPSRPFTHTGVDFNDTFDTDYMHLPLRWRLTENMYKEFWKKWSKDYLQTLQSRGKWQTQTQNMAVGDVVLVKEDHVPPARWLLGRVTETHPGSDNLVRVVSLKTKNSIMKRPITKLSRIPIEAGSSSVQSEGGKTDQLTNDSPKLRRKTRQGKISTFKACLATLMVLITCATSSLQEMANITSLEPSRLVYFDKIADLQVIQDQWKLVIYYNMSTYWKNVQAVETYVKRLQELQQRHTSCFGIATQFEHELKELHHYNEILKLEHGSRSKRGLINGIGNIANSLFGVLDDKFAEKYNKDIKLLQSNENHLLNLFKQHTSIIEGEYNLLQRNEQVMNRQFVVINKHLRNSLEQMKSDQDQATFITATAVTAVMMVANLRRIQDSLIDLVTDIHNGRVDTQLLKPDAFEKELNSIAGHVPKGLSLPCTNNVNCVRKMYKLASVHGKIIENFIIFEVKIPLASDEQYELTKVIPIPNIKGNSMFNIIPTAEYMAVNLNKNMIIPLSQENLLSCTYVNTNQLLCNFDLPIYDITTATNICEADIVNSRSTSNCHSTVSDCTNKWIKLHSKAAWLFTCCEECTMRILCPAGITSQTLRNTGILTLSAGCLMRGDNHIIHAHYNLQSNIELGNEEEMYIPETNINYFTTRNNNATAFDKIHLETHEQQLIGLQQQIKAVKEQQEIQTLKSADVEQHHYILYGFMSISGTIFIIWAYYQVKKRYFTTSQGNKSATPETKQSVELVITQPQPTHPDDRMRHTGTSPAPQ